MRQRAERTHLTVQGQRLYAADRRGLRIRRSLPNIRGAGRVSHQTISNEALLTRQLCPVQRVT